jgi:hypothetical protein
MQLKRSEVAIGAGLLLLLAVALVRVAVVDRSRIRPLSVHGFEIGDEPIGHGEEIVRESVWTPPETVYVLGWSYELGVMGEGAELALMAPPGDTRLFDVRGNAPASNPAFFQNGAAYLVRTGQPVRLRYRVLNTGPPGATRGASALVSFIPAAGN